MRALRDGEIFARCQYAGQRRRLRGAGGRVACANSRTRRAGAKAASRSSKRLLFAGGRHENADEARIYERDCASISSPLSAARAAAAALLRRLLRRLAARN